MKNNLKLGVAFLCIDLDEELISFGKEINQTLDCPVYFIADNPSGALKAPENCFLVNISDDLCIQSGYENCMITGQKVNTLLAKNPIAYDKMLYYFCNVELSVDFLLVFEDDCFIPSVKAIQNLFTKYQKYDLVVPNHNFKADDVLDWHWKSVVTKIDPPYYFSMVSAFGMSRKMLNAVSSYVVEKGTLFFTEVMFNTLAAQNKLKVIDVFELKTIVWQGEWNIDHFLLLQNNIFHPKKERELYKDLREQILKLKKSRKNPNKVLPSYLLELM